MVPYVHIDPVYAAPGYSPTAGGAGPSSLGENDETDGFETASESEA